MCITSNGIRGGYRRGVNREQSGKYASKEECMADCEYGRSPSGPVNYVSTGKSCSFSTQCETAVWGECTGYAQNCNIGDIVYSDGTCASTVVSGKTPIAVVVYKSSDGKCAQAMALNSIGNSRGLIYTYTWGPTSDDIPTLTNFETAEKASLDLNSCANTQKIIAAGDKSKYPAAWATHEYKTTGTNAGDWCLPAAGILTSYYNNVQQINIGMDNARGTRLGSSSYLWSSTEENSNSAWFSHFAVNYGIDTYYAGYYGKDRSGEIRPVLEF